MSKDIRESLKDSRNRLRMMVQLLVMMGAERVAPTEFTDNILEKLKLKNNNSFADASIALHESYKEERYNLIKGLMITTLTASQISRLGQYIQEYMNDYIEFIRDNEEHRVAPDMEAAIKLIGEDFDV